MLYNCTAIYQCILEVNLQYPNTRWQHNQNLPNKFASCKLTLPRHIVNRSWWYSVQLQRLVQSRRGTIVTVRKTNHRSVLGTITAPATDVRSVTELNSDGLAAVTGKNIFTRTVPFRQTVSPPRLSVHTYCARGNHFPVVRTRRIFGAKLVHLQLLVGNGTVKSVLGWLKV